MPRLMRGIFRRGGSWYHRVQSGGRDRWVSLGSDYQEACTKLRALRRGEQLAPAQVLTVASAARRWLDTYMATSRNSKGVRLATTRVETYLETFMGQMLVHKVTPDDLRSYRLWLENRGASQRLSQQTVAHILSDARCFFRWCEDSGFLSHSPVPRKLLPRMQEVPAQRFSDGEIEALVALPDPLGYSVRFLIGTGLRWAEACRAQASHTEGRMLVVSQTKTGRVRRVPIPSWLGGELRCRVGKLFPFAEASNSYFNRTVKELSGVAEFHVHRLRHTFASKYVEAGGTLPVLQRILGHSTVVTTQRYAKLTDGAVQDEAERVGLNFGTISSRISSNQGSPPESRAM